MNRFQVEVTAVDRFSKVFRRLNDSASKAVRPLSIAQRQVSTLSRELHVDKMVRGIGIMSRGAITLERNLGLAIQPMEAIAGIGARLGTAGGVLGGFAVVGAGATALAARFGKIGFEVNRTSQSLGVSADFLQRYRGAAKLASVPTEAFDGAVRGLSNSLYRAKYDGDALVQQTMAKLNIQFRKNRDGSLDLESSFMDLARVMSRITDPHTRRRVAEVFGIPEEALPMLMKGQQGLEDLGKRALTLGTVAGPQALAWADKFQTSLSNLGVTIEGVALKMGSKLLPNLPGVMDKAAQVMTGTGTGGASANPRGGSKPAPSFLDAVQGTGAYQWISNFNQRTLAASPRASKFVGPTLPLGLRQNNPGNLRSWGGVPTVNGFAAFPDRMQGLEAMAKQIGLYYNRDGLKTIDEIITKYAPPGGKDKNNTGAYIGDVSKQSGLKSGQQYDFNDQKTLASLLKGMVPHEQGVQPFTPEQYAAAVQSAIVAGMAQAKVQVSVHGAPQGSTGQGKLTAGFTPTRVSYPMPTGAAP